MRSKPGAKGGSASQQPDETSEEGQGPEGDEGPKGSEGSEAGPTQEEGLGDSVADLTEPPPLPLYSDEQIRARQGAV